jgi:hypothetical protein
MKPEVEKKHSVCEESTAWYVLLASAQGSDQNCQLQIIHAHLYVLFNESLYHLHSFDQHLTNF